VASAGIDVALSIAVNVRLRRLKSPHGIW